jgi:phosphoglycerate dehydrogenase-like enzyme
MLFENRPYPRDAVMACPSIEWVSNGGAGVDKVYPAERRAAQMFCDNIECWLAGEALDNVVDPARGY